MSSWESNIKVKASASELVQKSLPEKGKSASRIVMTHELLDALQVTLRKLPNQYQEVIQLRNYDRASFEESADVWNAQPKLLASFGCGMWRCCSRNWMREMTQSSLNPAPRSGPSDPETRYSQLLAQYDEALATAADASAVSPQSFVSNLPDAEGHRAIVVG